MTEKLNGTYRVSSLLHGDLLTVKGGGFFRITGETLGIEIQVHKSKHGDGDCIRIWANGGSDDVHRVYPVADLTSFMAGSMRGFSCKFHSKDNPPTTISYMFPQKSQGIVLQFVPDGKENK
ncbi:MAG TPA: hypothetical protein PK653_00085 [Syntrophales bacterium]|nr:hypothetical protein [Syntrophales bacterium]